MLGRAEGFDLCDFLECHGSRQPVAVIIDVIHQHVGSLVSLVGGTNISKSSLIRSITLKEVVVFEAALWSPPKITASRVGLVRISFVVCC